MQPLQAEGPAPQGFGSRIPSMASNFQEAATSFLEAARANAAQGAQGPAAAPTQAPESQQAQQAQQAVQQAWQSMPYLQLLQSMDSRQLQSLSTVSASPPPTERQPGQQHPCLSGLALAMGTLKPRLSYQAKPCSVFCCHLGIHVASTHGHRESANTVCKP